METVNMHEAKTHLSRLVARAEKGERIVIARSGKPVAVLTAIEADPVPRRIFGRDRGLLEIPDDFDAPLPSDILEAFEG